MGHASRSRDTFRKACEYRRYISTLEIRDIEVSKPVSLTRRLPLSMAHIEALASLGMLAIYHLDVSTQLD